MKTTARRLAALEIRAADRRAGDPIADWLELYRAGADVADMNAVAGPAWCAAAIERQRLALETLEAYDETFNNQPSGTA